MGISEVDFGVKFLTKCDKYFHQNNSEDAQSEIINVKEDCMSMLEEDLNQVSYRLPTARHIYQNLSSLSPLVILNQICIYWYISIWV